MPLHSRRAIYYTQLGLPEKGRSINRVSCQNGVLKEIYTLLSKIWFRDTQQ